MKLAAIGECMLEAVTGEPLFGKHMAFGFGGDTLNTAVYMYRTIPANSDMTISYVTALGNDPCSDQLVAAWRNEGLDDHLVFRLAGRLPGFYLIHNDTHGERQFFYWRQEAAARSLLDDGRDQLIAKGLSGFDLVYLTGITLAVLAQHNPDPVMSLLQQLADGGTQIAFDPNHRDTLWDNAEIAKSVYRDIAPLLTFCLPTFDDEQRLFKDRDPTVTATRWLDWGATEVIVKNGSKTALLATPWEQIHSYPIPIERVVDTTAAGDAFNASYLVRRLVGDPSQLAADAAHTLAAQVIQHKGAIAPLA
ncbi:MAG: sugar kinase [Arenicellales bacterium]|nr:sugar kinase [Arenicellales bacterium]